MLYLLSFIITCPTEYWDRVLDISLKDLKGERIVYNKEENIMKWNFEKAYKLLEKMISKLETYSPRFEIMKELLSQVIQKDKEFDGMLLALAKNKQYEELYSILFNTLYERQLTIKEENAIIIVDALIKTIRWEKIYTSNNIKTYSVSNALIYCDYKNALKNHFRNVNVANDIDNDVVTILLLDLCSLLNYDNKKEEVSKKIKIWKKLENMLVI